MDDLKTLLFSLILICSLPAAASEVEYISPERQHQLETLFGDAQFTAKDAQAIKSHAWTCDMFGVRTHLQVQRGLTLYKWTSSDWHNAGAQVVSDYQSSDAALIGQKDRFEDQVKMTKDGQLVSRLSLNSAQKTVIAYSVCKVL